jgi:glycosyltransferase involved in cell wall biosynthesis
VTIRRLSATFERAFRTSRSNFRGPDEVTFVPKGRSDVLFLFDETGPWTRYRCDHQAEQLSFAGLSCDVVQTTAVDLDRVLGHYDAIVLSRVPWRREIAALRHHARLRGTVVVFDTDDLLFEPELDRFFAFLDREPEIAREGWVATLGGYRETLRAADAALVATEPLGRHAQRHLRHVDVSFNAVSEEMVRRARVAMSEAREKSAQDVVIAYLSGTPTHDRDFREAADAIMWILQTYPNARLLVVGKLTLDARFGQFEGRVEHLPKQPWDALPGILARVDVNLAPLERANPFTECKSCVKYLEAGLLGVPTIASRRPDFERVIAHGHNGLLADTPDEWRAALRFLIESSDSRRMIGQHAHEDVHANRTTRARASDLAASFQRALSLIGAESTYASTRRDMTPRELDA